MGKGMSQSVGAHELEPVSLSALIHQHVRAAIAARTAYTLFERTWGKRCSGVVTSLRESGEELLTFFRFPKEQWKTLRTTNTIERLHDEFRRRVKTQSSLPTG